MSRIFLSALSLLVAWPAFTAEAQDTFKVVSLNLQLSGTKATRNGALIGPRAASSLFGEFLSLRLGTSAGLVSLQEVDVDTARCNFDMPEAIDDRLGGSWFHRFGRAMGSGGGDYGNAILANVPLASANVQSWPFAFDAAKGAQCKEDRRREPGDHESCDFGTEPRQATAAKFDFGSGRALWFVAVHMDFHVRVPTEQQLFEMIGKTKTFDPDFPVIIAGDFNIPPSGGEHDAAVQTMELAGYTLVGHSEVDYVFLYDPNHRLDVTGTANVPPIRGDVVLSDHAALVVSFAWRP